MALRVVSPRRINSVAIGGIADIARSTGALGSDVNDPRPDIGRLEIPQCSDLLRHLVCYHWVGSAAGSAAPHVDSERFRFSLRTCWLLCGRLSVR
jgi:hypothetical protein